MVSLVAVGWIPRSGVSPSKLSMGRSRKANCYLAAIGSSELCIFTR
jgi:hypothetical protein